VALPRDANKKEKRRYVEMISGKLFETIPQSSPPSVNEYKEMKVTSSQ